MDAFFLITPPTCKTYLMTSFDADCKNAVCFEPPAQKSRPPSGESEQEDFSDTGAANTEAWPEEPEPLWRRISCCRRRPQKEDSAERRRIQELEKVVEELKRGMEQANKRIAVLEASVPWAKTVEQINSTNTTSPFEQFEQWRQRWDWSMTRAGTSPNTSSANSSPQRNEPRTPSELRRRSQW